jgi:hypothetical protein
MANELNLSHPLAVFQYTIANVGAGATPVDGILAGSPNTAPVGFLVPTGYKFVPVFIDARYNDARTGGTSTVKVTDNGAEVSGGPEALIDGTNTLRDTGSVTGAPVSIAAGREVSVSATGAGTFAPATADADVILYGYFLPA